MNLKSLLLLSLVLIPGLLSAQTSFYGIWEDQNTQVYHFVSVDVATGSRTNIAPIPGLTGLVIPGTTTFDTWDNQYVFYGLYANQTALTWIDIASGMITRTVYTSENLIGLEYNCSNDTIYALKEANNAYSFVALDPLTGARIPIATLPPITAHVGGSFTLNTQRGIYSFRGMAGGSFGIFEVDIHSGALLNSFALTENVVGHEYDCNSDTVYAVWEDRQAGTYNLVWVNPATGLFGVVNTLLGVDPGYLSESDCYSPSTGHYYFRGFSGPNLFLYAVNVTNGNIVSNPPMTDNVVGWEMDVCCSVVCPVPQPDFGWTSQNLAVTFSDSSLGATGWHWDFGDGDTANGNPVNHTYALPGTYQVCLTASNYCGDSTFCQTLEVTCPLPAANWAWTSNQFSVTFSDSSTGTTAWTWTFGDGGTDTSANPMHTYQMDGTYEVCLIAINDCGSDTLCDSITVIGTGMPEVQATPGFRLYPNPSKGRVVVYLEQGVAGIGTLRVVDPLGRVVFVEANWSSGEREKVLDLSDLEEGLYFFWLEAPGFLVHSKFLLY